MKRRQIRLGGRRNSTPKKSIFHQVHIRATTKQLNAWHRNARDTGRSLQAWASLVLDGKL